MNVKEYGKVILTLMLTLRKGSITSVTRDIVGIPRVLEPHEQ